MTKLTISDAARVTGVSRMLLYRYIKTGKLSRTPDGLLDTAELLRAGLLLQQSDVTTPVTLLHDVTPSRDTPVTPVTSAVTPPVTTPVPSEVRTLERLIDVLQRELDAARERETTLLQMLSQMQQQNQRLLEAATRPPAPSAPAPLHRSHEAPEPSPGLASPATPQDPLLAQILRWQDEGLSLRAIAAKLNAEGVPTRSGQGKWYQSNLSRELRRVGRGR
jgi:hypothetical protein